MSVTKAYALSQIQRVSTVMIWYPQGEAAVQEWIRVLMKHCISNDHVERVITEFLETTQNCQNPIERIVSLAKETATAGQAPAGCEECAEQERDENGQIQYANHVFTTGADGTEYYGRCHCARGQWLKNLDAERSHKSAAEQAKRQAQPTKMKQIGDLKRPN